MKCRCCSNTYDGRTKQGCSECWGVLSHSCAECRACPLHCCCDKRTVRLKRVDFNDYEYQQRMAEKNIGAKEDGNQDS